MLTEAQALTVRFPSEATCNVMIKRKSVDSNNGKNDTVKDYKMKKKRLYTRPKCPDFIQ